MNLSKTRHKVSSNNAPLYAWKAHSVMLGLHSFLPRRSEREKQNLRSTYQHIVQVCRRRTAVFTVSDKAVHTAELRESPYSDSPTRTPVTKVLIALLSYWHQRPNSVSVTQQTVCQILRILNLWWMLLCCAVFLANECTIQQTPTRPPCQYRNERVTVPKNNLFLICTT